MFFLPRVSNTAPSKVKAELLYLYVEPVPIFGVHEDRRGLFQIVLAADIAELYWFFGSGLGLFRTQARCDNNCSTVCVWWLGMAGMKLRVFFLMSNPSFSFIRIARVAPMDLPTEAV